MKKDIQLYIGLAVIVLVIIGVVFYLKFMNSSEKLDATTAKCIAGRTELYSSATCPHCKTQKEIIGDYYNLFNVTDCFYDVQKCEDAKIPGTPTWIVNGEQHVGVQTIKQLKELTGC